MALSGESDANQAPFSTMWKIYRKVSDRFYILYQYQFGRVTYAPLYIHSFCFTSNQYFIKVQNFLCENPEPEKLSTVSDKLKWYRYQKGFLQSAVAKAMGINRTTYSRYEENVLEAYPLDKLAKAAELFHIEITALLDNYNLFLYHGQGQQIKRLRKSLQLTQSQLAKYLDTPLGTLKKWEQDQVHIQKKTFEKLLRFQSIQSNDTKVSAPIRSDIE